VIQICVALDLETTGLDPESDRIIEIGAVKFFLGNECLETFHTLVNPQRPLPNRVRLITGITAEELESAPVFSSVAGQLLSFVGDHPIVGQNIGFDLDFLRAAGLSFSNTAYDVYELANILFPWLDDYSLQALARQLGIPCPVCHRALDDAATAKGVFLALLDRVAGLDLPVVAEVNRMTMASAWPWRPFFLEAERIKAGGVSLWDREAWEADFTPGTMDLAQCRPLVRESVLEPLDIDRLAAILGEGGPMSQAFPGFEYRPGQVSMMRWVAEAMNSGRHLIVEAGTGIGKSVAYLLPSVFFAFRNSAPVVISTNTINLQEQLMNKDIPDLLATLGRVEDQDISSDLRVAQLKGRTNYLCLRKWNSWRKTPELPWEETRFLLRLLLWLSSTNSGDRAELNLVGNETYLWDRVCASEDNCVTERCSYYPAGCFLYRARQKTEGAHLIVVNHALLLSDLAKSRGILPEYSYLVIDEAHHLEGEATEQLGYRIGSRDIYGCLEPLGDKGGFLFHLRSYLRAASVASLRRREIEQKVDDLLGKGKVVRASVAELLGVIKYLVNLLLGEQAEYERNLRFTREVRRHALWSGVELSWENLDLELGSVDKGLGELCMMIEELPDKRNPDLNSCLSEISSLRQRISGLRSRMDAVIAKPDADTICWAGITWQDDVYLQAAPLQVGKLLEKLLFSRKDCVVLTSATLTTGGSFEYIKGCLGLEEADELMIEAPFDYMSSTLIYLPGDISEPDKAAYQRGVGQTLVEVCRGTRGRTLALFTSHAALRSAYAAVQPPLEEEGILVLGQGIDGSPKKVLNNFKANQNSVLLGAAALWEGVDVVGRGLSVLVIARLPFSVPTDPVFSARAALFDDPFNEYLVPQAVLKFKQGFGRLIRSRSDRGVVILLDKRLQTKSYGKVFLESLPNCTVRTGKLQQMPQEVLEWLGD